MHIDDRLANMAGVQFFWSAVSGSKRKDNTTQLYVGYVAYSPNTEGRLHKEFVRDVVLDAGLRYVTKDAKKHISVLQHMVKDHENAFMTSFVGECNDSALDVV